MNSDHVKDFRNPTDNNGGFFFSPNSLDDVTLQDGTPGLQRILANNITALWGPYILRGLDVQSTVVAEGEAVFPTTGIVQIAETSLATIGGSGNYIYLTGAGVLSRESTLLTPTTSKLLIDVYESGAWYVMNSTATRTWLNKDFRLVDSDLTVDGNVTVVGDLNLDDIVSDDISCDTLAATTSVGVGTNLITSTGLTVGNSVIATGDISTGLTGTFKFSTAASMYFSTHLYLKSTNDLKIWVDSGTNTLPRTLDISWDGSAVVVNGSSVVLQIGTAVTRALKLWSADIDATVANLGGVEFSSGSITSCGGITIDAGGTVSIGDAACVRLISPSTSGTVTYLGEVPTDVSHASIGSRKTGSAAYPFVKVASVQHSGTADPSTPGYNGAYDGEIVCSHSSTYSHIYLWLWVNGHWTRIAGTTI